MCAEGCAGQSCVLGTPLLSGIVSCLEVLLLHPSPPSVAATPPDEVTELSCLALARAVLEAHRQTHVTVLTLLALISFASLDSSMLQLSLSAPGTP